MKRGYDSDPVNESQSESDTESSAESPPWVDKYRPLVASKACVNPKKLAEVRHALELMVSGSSATRILVVSGPPGSSKSTVVELVARELGPLIEYPGGNFRDFLNGCRHVNGVIMVEELPNVFHGDTLDEFRACLAEWLYGRRGPPLVLVLSEIDMPSDARIYSVETCLCVETLLGRSLASAAGVQRIRFLHIAKTFMERTLKGICAAEGLPHSAIDALGGDIRLAVCNLEFWALPLSVGRDLLLLLFHAVGKVVHSSARYSGLGAEEADAQSVLDVLDSYANHGLLQLALLENYQIVHISVQQAAAATDALSTADVLRSHDYGVGAVRSLLRSAEKKGRTQPMKFPRHFKVLREANRVRLEVGAYAQRHNVSFDVANLLDGCLVPLIRNSTRFQKMHPTRYTYNRLGGRLRELSAEEGVTVMDTEHEAETGLRDQFAVERELETELQSEIDDAIEDSDETDEMDDFDDVDWLVSQGKL